MIKNISSQLFFNILTILISLISTIIISRYLGPEVYGHFQSIIAAFLFLQLIEYLLYPTEIRKDLHDKDKLNIVITTSIFGSILNIIIVTVLTFIFLFFNKSSNYSPLIYLFCFWPLRPFVIINNIYNNNNKFNLTSCIEFTSTLIIELLKILVILYGSENINILLSLNSAKFLIVAIANLTFIKKYVPNYTFQISFPYYIKLVKRSLPLFISQLATILFLKSDVLMLEHLSTKTDVGLYSIAVKLVEPWVFICAAFNNYFFNLIIKNDLEERSIIKDASTTLILISLTIILGVYFLSPYVIDLIFGNKYSNSIDLIKISIFSLPFLYWFHLQHIWEVKHNYTKFTLCKTFIAALINISTNLYLIPEYGAKGACISTLISYATVGLVINVTTKKSRYFLKLQLRSLITPNIKNILKLFK